MILILLFSNLLKKSLKSPLITEKINNNQRAKGINLNILNYTQPVGFAKPATLHAPFAGPDGNNS